MGWTNEIPNPLVVGGSGAGSGQIEVRDENGQTIGIIDENGIVIYNPTTGDIVAVISRDGISAIDIPSVEDPPGIAEAYAQMSAGYLLLSPYGAGTGDLPARLYANTETVISLLQIESPEVSGYSRAYITLKSAHSLGGSNAVYGAALHSFVGDMTITGTVAASGGLTLAGNDVAALFSAWDTWTPTWTSTGTQPSIGDGELSGTYKKLGKTLFYRMYLQPGNTTTFGTGQYRFSMPADIVKEQTASAIFRDNSAALEYSCTAWLQTLGGNAVRVVYGNSELSGTIPVAWGTTDRLEITGICEVA